MGVAASSNTLGVGNPENTEQAQQSSDARKAALEKFWKITIGQFLIGAALLVCGILAIMHYNPDTFFGPPYFIGGMVVGPMLLLGALSTFMLRRHAAQYEQSETAKAQARCDMQGVQITTMFTFMGCFMGFVMVGISGVLSKDRDCWSCEEDPHKSTNRSLGIAIVILLVIAFLFAIFIMHAFCTSAFAFGVVAGNRRSVMLRQQHLLATQMMLNQQMLNQQQQMGAGGTQFGATTFNTTTPGMFGNQGAQNEQQVAELQRQNQLLQQQINMMQNQQQQPPMYPPTGFAPPPPSYDSVTGLTPSAPYPK